MKLHTKKVQLGNKEAAGNCERRVYQSILVAACESFGVGVMGVLGRAALLKIWIAGKGLSTNGRIRHSLHPLIRPTTQLVVGLNFKKINFYE